MKILLCTAEEILLTTLEYRFRKHGWQLVVAKDVKEALAITKRQFPDLVIVDLQLPEYGGLDIVQFLHKDISPDTPLLTACDLSGDGEKLLLESIRLGAKDFILKPLKADELSLRVRRLLAR